MATAVHAGVEDILGGSAHLLDGEWVAGIGDVVGGYVPVDQAAGASVVDGAGGIHPFWQMTAQNPNATYVSINRGEAVCPKEIQSRSICIDADIDEILPQLRKG